MFCVLMFTLFLPPQILPDEVYICYFSCEVLGVQYSIFVLTYVLYFIQKGFILLSLHYLRYSYNGYSSFSFLEREMWCWLLCLYSDVANRMFPTGCYQFNLDVLTH